MLPNVEKLIIKYPDDKRHPLVVDSDEWDNSITPALGEWAYTIGAGTIDSVTMMRLLRFVVEAVYVMGYERAMNEKNNE